MDSYYWSFSLIYLIGLFIEFLWLAHIDKEDGIKRDLVNFLEAIFWPITLPVSIIFLILILIFEGILKSVVYSHQQIRKSVRRYRGH